MAKLKKCQVKDCNKPATEKMMVVVFDKDKVKISYRYLCREHYEKELEEV